MVQPNCMLSSPKSIQGKNKSSTLFSIWLQPRFSRGWTIIVRTSIILAVTLVFFADGGDIIKPLDNEYRQSYSTPSTIEIEVTPIQEHRDWSTNGFTQNSNLN